MYARRFPAACVGSSSSRLKSSFDVFQIPRCPVTPLSTGSTLSTLPFSAAARSSTASFVGSSTQSSRRSTTSGRITRPYSDCL